MKFINRTKKRWNFGVAIIILVTLIIIGLALGGLNFAMNIFKNYMIGIAIASAIYLVMLILGRTALRKNRTFKRFTR